jgi:membrane protein
MRHLVRALIVGAARFFEHACTQMAAAFAYHVLFSLFPFAILFVSIAGLVLRDESRRESVTDWLLEQLPLTGSGADDLVRTVEGVASPTSVVGLVAIVGVLWSASGMISTIRITLARIWGAPGARPFYHSKLLDLALVLLIALLVLGAFALTVVVQAVSGVAARVATDIGLPGDGFASGRMLQFGVSTTVAFATILLLYRIVPPVEVHLRDLWPAAALAAVALQLVTTGYGLYLERVADLNVVYGSLGAVIGFLLLVYLAAFVLFMGAEVAAAWPETRTPPRIGDPDAPLHRRTLARVRALLRSPEPGSPTRDDGD